VIKTGLLEPLKKNDFFLPFFERFLLTLFFPDKIKKAYAATLPEVLLNFIFSPFKRELL
jgi:hypothetical protein